MLTRALLCLGVMAAACGDGTVTVTADGPPGSGGADAAGPGPGDPDADPNAPQVDAAMSPVGVRGRAIALAEHIAGEARFLVGIGNDNSGPYDHDVPIDLHYAYLVGYGDSGGWPSWNEGGMYPVYFAEAAREHEVAPMYIYYQLALELEQGNDGVFTDESRMRQYLLDMRLLFERLDELDTPAVIVLEPDFFGYLEQRVATSGTPASEMPARLRFADVHDCDALPETVAGLTRCVVDMAHTIAPKVRIGFHASMWGAWYDALDPDADIEGAAGQVAEFLRSVGADDMDFVAVETLDRDAGFWETSGGGPSCSITGGSRGAVYWDEANVELPNFRQHLRWVGALTEALERPALWWQTPLGVPSDTCGGEGGGSDGNWRDNRVHYFFAHTGELVAAGGVGATFGTGAGGQTTLSSDGDQLKNAATAYRADPHPL